MHAFRERPFGQISSGPDSLAQHLVHALQWSLADTGTKGLQPSAGQGGRRLAQTPPPLVEAPLTVAKVPAPLVETPPTMGMPLLPPGRPQAQH